jgi:hypothetical protein
MRRIRALAMAHTTLRHFASMTRGEGSADLAQAAEVIQGMIKQISRDNVNRTMRRFKARHAVPAHSGGRGRARGRGRKLTRRRTKQTGD